MATLAWSPALRNEVKRLKFLSLNEHEQSLSSIHHASGYLSVHEKRAVEKTFSTEESEQEKSTYNFWW